MNISGFSQIVMMVANLLNPIAPQDYNEVEYRLNPDPDTVQTEIIQATPATAPIQEKIAIAVMELDANGVTQAEAKALTDRLRIELFNASVFLVMERDKMNKILDEMEFQMSGCTSDECVVEVGRIVGVKKIIAGSVSKVGEIYSVSLRLIDVETSKIEATAIEDFEGTLGTVLTGAVPSVARQISGLEKPTYDVRGKKTAFKVNTQPWGASVFVDDLYYGIAPLEIEVIPDLTHKLTVIDENYEKWEQYYDIKKNQVLEINVALSKKPEAVAVKPAEKPKRQFNNGFKIRYVDFQITDDINRQIRMINEVMQEKSIFSRRAIGELSFGEIDRFAGIELYNMRQLGNAMGFDFGLGFYRSDFTQWIKNFDNTYSEPTLIFWMPTINLNLRIAPIRYPLFYPYLDIGLGYNVLIIDGVEDNKSMGSPIFQNWGLIYGVGVEIRPFKFIGISLEWDHRVLNYRLMNVDNQVTERFKNADVTEMDLSGKNIGLSINIYY
jgi:TolB-like protein